MQNNINSCKFCFKAHKMRKLLKDSELQSEEHRERLNEIMLQKEKLSVELEQLSQEYQK